MDASGSGGPEPGAEGRGAHGPAAAADRVATILDGLAQGAAPAGSVDLRGLDASPTALAAHAARAAPAWWDAARGGVALPGATLAGAALGGADLSGADLRRADLTGAHGRSARFEGAILEAATFDDADLSGASFAGIFAGQVSFRRAMLEDAVFTGAAMRFARFAGASLDGAGFERADLWGADLSGADADDTVFRGARLDEANLSDANLTHADFTGASLKRARLVGSRLRGVSFADVKIDGADLSGADLSETTLVRLNLASCRLTHARFAGAWLDGTRMRIEQLGGAVGEEVAGEFAAARASYLALEQNLISIGSHDEANWAYRRGRRMGRMQAGASTRAAWRAGDRAALVRDGYRWIADRFVEWLCDYGVSLSRIVRAFAVGIVLFAVGYGLTGGMIVDDPAHLPTYNPLDLLTYSGLNMLTSNPPDIGLKPTGRVTNLLVGVQGAMGIVLLGLFGFVLGNRLRS